jgi:hypothetical protein
MNKSVTQVLSEFRFGGLKCKGINWHFQNYMFYGHIPKMRGGREEEKGEEKENRQFNSYS